MVEEQQVSDAAKATYDKAKGTFKEAVGAAFGNPALAAEGQALREAAERQSTRESTPAHTAGPGLTARDIMTADVRCVRSSDTVVAAARLLAEAQIGSVPVYGEDNTLKGMLTDRDIVTKVIAQGMNPISVHVSEIVTGRIVTVDANASVSELLRTMAEHQIRRVPVLDNGALVGIIAQADVARALDDPPVGELLGALSTP